MDTRKIYGFQYAVLVLALIGAGLTACNPRQASRLEHASSPYLRDHADNPVDWYEWGDEALAKAKAENKPLLISIGYASCHWCHVMEKESFMDTAVARIMNEQFVCIKVDREERPDIDQVYSDACQLLTGSSGWPLNAFALPDGKPFFAGTYYNKASWTNLLTRIAETYRSSPGKVRLQAESLAMGVRQQVLEMPADSGGKELSSFYKDTYQKLSAELDLVNGGVKGPTRFPAPYLIEYLLQDYYITGNNKSLIAATLALDRMALGGIYDQLGFGFSRYTVDSTWHVPHFEKMLYDNAQLVSVYSHAFQLTRDPFYKTIAVQTASFLLSELGTATGAFYSSLNADSDGNEGEYYTWTSAALKNALGKDYAVVAGYYKIKDNAEQQVLFPGQDAGTYARSEKLDSTAFQNILEKAGDKLRLSRASRQKPRVDKKILASWNALALSAFADLYAATSDPVHLKSALAVATYIDNNLLDTAGNLQRMMVDNNGQQNSKPGNTGAQSVAGNAGLQGMLEDYAYAGAAMLRLYQVTFDKHWLDLSARITQKASQLFYDNKSGFFYSTGTDIGGTGIRVIPLADNGLPSPNAILARTMCFLSVYFQDDGLLSKSERVMSAFSKQRPTQHPAAYASWYSLAGIHMEGLSEVAVIGSTAIAINRELQRDYLPLSAWMGSAGKENLPLLEGKEVAGTTLVYVCENRTCKRPVNNPEMAIAQIRQLRDKNTNRLKEK